MLNCFPPIGTECDEKERNGKLKHEEIDEKEKLEITAGDRDSRK